MHRSNLRELISLSALINERQQSSGKTDSQIAAEIGLDRPSIFALIKQGRMKPTIAQIPALAAALDIDPAGLLRAFMSEHLPGVMEIVEQVFKRTCLTQTEQRLLEHCRNLSRGRVATPLVFDGHSVIALVTA